MIRVPSPIQEPATFNDECRQRGIIWLQARAAGRPRDYWSPFRDDLAEGFSWRCGYRELLRLGADQCQLYECELPSTTLCDWLGDSADAARMLFASGKRLAQERMNWEFLNSVTSMQRLMVSAEI